MMRLFMKKRGSVSIFLVIILVPMITVTSLFVDAARMKLAQSVAASAGDLALNTVLTQYDGDLKDYYGLMAASKDVDEFLGVMDEYYKASLVSQGVDVTFADQVSSQLTDILGGEKDFSDFLQIEMEEDAFSLGAAPNGYLTNPAIVKKQIVEFMKYRSPINASAELFDALKKAQKQAEAVPHETDMTKKKRDFYKAEHSLLKDLKKAYFDIQKYNEVGITDQVIENMKTSMASYKATYKKLHKKLVYDLCGAQGYGVFPKYEIAKPTTAPLYSDANPSDIGNVKNCVNNTIVAMDAYVKAEKKLGNADSIYSLNQNAYPLRYWVGMMDALNGGETYRDYAGKANSLWRNIEQLNNAVKYCKDWETVKSEQYAFKVYDTVDVTQSYKTNKKTSYENLVNGLQEQFNSIERKEFKNSQSVYHRLGDDLARISKKAVNGDSTIEANGTRSPNMTSNTVADISKQLGVFYTQLENGEKKVDDAVGNLQWAKTKLNNYQKKYKAWKDKVNNFPVEGNEMQAADAEEIKKLEENGILTAVTSEKIDELINRLNNIKGLLGSMKKGIDAYEYNGTPLRQITNYSDMERASKIQKKDIPYIKSELESYATTTFKFSEADRMQNITKNNNPHIEMVNTPELYEWMNTKFKNENEEEAEKAEQKREEYENLDKQQSSEKDTAQSGTDQPELCEIANKLSDGSKEEEKKEDGLDSSSTFLGDLFKDFGGTLSNATNNIINSLYFADYINSMFSYDAMEKEAAFDQKQEGTQGKEIKFRSLTNTPIDTEHCYSYGNEVEYILYGNTNAKNKASSYGSIFMIRYGFNLAPVFQKYMGTSGNTPGKPRPPEVQIVINIAHAISVATSGVVPEMLIRIAICLGLVAAESAVDLSHIKNGEGIKLLKKKDEIFVSFSGDGNDEMSGSISKDQKQDDHPAIGTKLPNYFQYSDYLTLFLLLRLNNSQKADQIYLRTADVIQSNTGKMIGESNLNLKTRPVYYKLNAKVKVKPIMIGMPINSGVDQDVFDKAQWNQFQYEEIRGY